MVVGSPQSLTVPQTTSQPYTERVPVPAAWVAEISRVPGVKTAMGDVRLIGVTRRQVHAMMRCETAIIAAVAVVIGSLAALPPLIGTSAGITGGNPVPDIPPLEYLAIVAAVVALAWGSIMISARLATRSRLADAQAAADSVGRYRKYLPVQTG